MKYEYMLQVGGGFFNEEFRAIHKIEEDYYYFDTAEERETFIEKLRYIEEDLGAKFLITETEEGYNLRTDTVLHRVIKYQGKDYHSSINLGRGYPFDAAKNYLENKWHLGSNDYPLGEDFDYNKKGVEVIAEWIDGSFCVEEDDQWL